MTKQKKKRKKRPHKKITANLGIQKYFNIYATPLERQLDVEFTEYILNATNDLVDEFLNRMIKCDTAFENKVNSKLKKYREEIYDSLLSKVNEFVESKVPFEDFEDRFTEHLTKHQLEILDYLHDGYIEVGNGIIDSCQLDNLMNNFVNGISNKLKQLVIMSPTEIFHSRLATRATTATRVVEVNVKHLLQCANANVNDVMYNYYTTFSGILVDVFRRILYDKEINNIEFETTKVIEEQENIPKEYKHRTWRELNAIAVNRGYELDRCNGDHAIYVNSNGKVVIIPQGRDIGKGLQIAILKDIENS